MIKHADKNSKENNKSIILNTLENNHIRVKTINIGAVIQSLYVKNNLGQWTDIVLGFDDVQEYQSNNKPALGSVHAIVTNRIKNATFMLGGKKYNLPKDEFDNSLHCGDLRYLLWDIIEFSNEKIIYRCSVSDGYEGLPGPAVIEITYFIGFIDGKPFLNIDFALKAKENTIIGNLTHHNYFNLDGDCKNKLRYHNLQINADKYLELDGSTVPTGKILPVSDIFDFRHPQNLSLSIDRLLESSESQTGYDIFYIGQLECNLNYHPIATLSSCYSGIKMDVYTDYPGLQLYSANFLSGVKGKKQESYSPYSAVCLETHIHPDAINHDHFPSIVVPPYGLRNYATRYVFSVI